MRGFRVEATEVNKNIHYFVVLKNGSGGTGQPSVWSLKSRERRKLFENTTKANTHSTLRENVIHFIYY